MSTPRLERPGLYVLPAAPSIGVGVAVGGWLTAWLVGQLAASVIVAAFGTRLDEAALGVVAAAVAASWGAYLVVLVAVSHRHGGGRFADDYGLRFSPRDLIGIPVGVLTQLLLLPLVYVPLRQIWPATFSDQRLSDNADGLAARAPGGGIVVLVAIVVVGAPIVEELVYRGLLQRTLSARVNVVVGCVVVAALFTLIHLRPVEYPGLAALALVLGACAALTHRLGLPIVAHAAFNGTGLLLAYE